METNKANSVARSGVSVGRVLRPLRGLRLGRIWTLLDNNEVLIVLLVLMVIAPQLSDKFLTELNIKNLLRQSSIIGILAISQFLVILISGFDLSVAGILAMSSVIIAHYTPEVGVRTATLYALGAGSGIGLLNGLAVTKGRVPPLIATLASLGISRGLAFTVTEKSLYVRDPLLEDINGWTYGVLTGPTVIWIVLAVLVFLFLMLTRTGMRIYAIGGNEDTARLAGVKVDRIKLGVYIFAGFMSAVGGLIFVIRSRSGVPHVGTGWELTTIAAVIIGGSNLFGGEGNILKAMVGVFIYQSISNIMNLMRLDPFYQDIVRAGVILIAVGFSMWQSARRRKRMAD